MEATVYGAFPSKTLPVEVLESLAQARLTAEPLAVVGEPDSFLPAVSLESDKPNKLMIALGVVGIVVGCAVGFAAIHHIQSRELMHLLILPLSGAFWGLGVGMTAAMILSDSLHLDKVVPAQFEEWTENRPAEYITIAVRAKTEAEIDRAQTLMAELGAIYLSIKVQPDGEHDEASPNTEPLYVVLGKTA